MKELLEIKNPTVGQLIYMKNLFSKDELLQYMVNKWSYKFNRNLSDKDQKQFRSEIKYLGLNLMEVLINIEDEYLI